MYGEVYLNGLEKQVPELESLKGLFESGVIYVLPESNNVTEDLELFNESGLHKGEITIVQMALSLHATAIIDDKRARNVAKLMGVNLGGTVSIIIEFVRMKEISKSEAKEAVTKMVNEGWYCSTRDFVLMMRAIDTA